MNRIELALFDIVYCEHCRKYSRITDIIQDDKKGNIKIILECGQEIHCGKHPKNKLLNRGSE